MIIGVIGCVCGIVVGMLLSNYYTIDPIYSVYVYLIILSLANTMISIITKSKNRQLKLLSCCLYVFIDLIIAFVLAFISEKLGLPLYLVAVFAFGNSIYKNLYFYINNIIKKKKV